MEPQPTRRLQHSGSPDDTFIETEYDARSSVEITRTAAGKNSWSVKCYNADLAEAKRQAKAIHDQLDAEYGVAE